MTTDKRNAAKERPAVIAGVRVERWVNYPWPESPTRFRLLGVVVPVGMMKDDPLNTDILSEIEKRVNSYDRSQEVIARLVEAIKDLLPFVHGVLYDDAPTKYRKAQEALAKATALQEKGEK